MATHSAGYCLRFILQNPRFALAIAFILNVGLLLVFMKSETAQASGGIITTVQLTRKTNDENMPLSYDTDALKDECWDYRRMASMDRPKALDILGNSKFIEQHEKDKITIVTHLTDDRIDRLETMLRNWEGPIAATIYVGKSDFRGLLDTIDKSQSLLTRQNLQLHIVQKDGDLYPVNYLRNTGLNNTVTLFVFPVDVDLIPSPGAHTMLQQYTMNMEREIFIVPAFQETSIEWNLKEMFPKSKDDLTSLWEKEHVIPFLSGEKQCKKCHKPTDFQKWKNSTEIYWVAYRRYFEPYLVGKKHEIPTFSEWYGGRFKDKISFVEEIYAMRHTFNVVPDVFLLHLWHERSDQFNDLWNKCSNKAEERFENYLKQKYPGFSDLIWW